MRGKTRELGFGRAGDEVGLEHERSAGLELFSRDEEEERMSKSDVDAIVDGLFQANARLGDITDHLAAIRDLLEEDDGRGDEEEG